MEQDRSAAPAPGEGGAPYRAPRLRHIGNVADITKDTFSCPGCPGLGTRNDGLPPWLRQE